MRVSAVVPVYNSINTLERAINSLLIQPEINEIFLVDDGSTDGSFQLELDLESNNPIIKVLTHPERINKGASASRNLGLFHCSNEWIQFLDADDELMQSKVSIQILSVNSRIGLVVSPYIYNKSGVCFKHYLLYGDEWAGLLMTMLGRTSSILWRRKILMDVGWREEMENVQEYYLMFDILKSGYSVAFCPYFLTNIYYTNSSISNTLSENKRNNLVIFREDIKSFLISSKKFTWKRYYYYSVSLGKVYQNFKPSYSTNYNKFIYFSHRVLSKVFSLIN